MLHLKDVDVYYGGVQAIFGISLHVQKGEIVTLVGANGAGKSTLLRAISGVIPARGSAVLGDTQLFGREPEDVIRMGIVHVPEGRRIFPGLTVVENLEVAAYALGYSEQQVRSDIARVLDIFSNLRARANAYGWSLSGGEQQMLAIGRGLMARPKLLLLDEPSLGLAPRLIEEVFAVVGEIRKTGTTILLVEQNAAMALSLADRGYVIETGRVVAEGTGQELRKDPAIVAAYMGGTATEL